MLGLISTLNIARKGMSAQQASINVTSHNIANANTEGYSRQRANLQTSTPFETPSMNSSAGPGQMGTGVDVASIDRIRNSFLDYQVRSETSNKGYYEFREQFLSNIEGIMNEPKDTGLSNAMSEFYNSWQELSTHPESAETRTSVLQKTTALTDMLNHTYNQLEKLKEDVHVTIDQSVYDINNYLDQLDSINQEVMQIAIAGQRPNDLEDRRDLLLDKLSAKFNINVDRGQPYDGQDVAPVDRNGVTDPTMVKSVFNNEVKRLSYVQDVSLKDGTSSPKTYTVTYYKNGDMTKTSNMMQVDVKLTDDEKKQLEECRVIWANKDGIAIDSSNKPITTSSASKLVLFQPSSGELSGQMSIQKDIDEYEEELNALAKTIALSVNSVHSGVDNNTTKDTLPFFVSSKGGSEDTINAGNITVNDAIKNDVMKIKASTTGNSAVDGITDGKRALAIAQLKDVSFNIQIVNSTTTRKQFITSNGSLVQNANKVPTFTSQSSGIKMDAYFKDIISRLGVQSQQATKVVENKESLLTQFKTQRDSVSGVSIDEEMSNLIQYQHSYSANAKIISTVDELLDVLINGLKK